MLLNIVNHANVSWFIHACRKVRHRNVVQFIGACTRQPTLYIVTGILQWDSSLQYAWISLVFDPLNTFLHFLVSDFMSGGSVYDYLHKNNNAFKLPEILKVATDISKGMNYLHQNNIIHRDLKTANLLMDENRVRIFFSQNHKPSQKVMEFLLFTKKKKKKDLTQFTSETGHQTIQQHN